MPKTSKKSQPEAEPLIPEVLPEEDTQSKEKPASESELNDKLLRLAAEFDNYKKRTERERVSIGEFAKANTLKAFVPVLDNIDLALAADPGSPDYVKGVEMMVRQIKEELLKLGLIAINPEGELFDPSVHDAVMHVEDESFPENTVAQVLQKGYKYGETVLRPAMVKVAN